MTLQELIGSGSLGRVAGAPDAGDTAIVSVVHRAQDAVPGSLFCAIRGARADGHDHAAEAVARGAVALIVERELDLPVPQIVADDARLSMALAAAAVAGDPSRSLDGGRRDRHQRQDDLRLPDPRGARGGRPSLRAGGDDRGARRRAPRAGDPHHARRGRAAGAVRPDALRRRRGLRHGGVLARAHPAPRGRHPLRGRPLHQPHPGPPRLPPRPRELLRGQAGPVRPPAGGGGRPARGGQPRRRVRPPPGARDRGPRLRRDRPGRGAPQRGPRPGDRHRGAHRDAPRPGRRRDAPARALQPVQPARRGRGGRAAGAAPRRPGPRGRRPRGRARALRGHRPRPALPGDRRLRPHARLPRQRAARRARAGGRRPPGRGLRLRRRPRPRQAPPDGRRGARAWPTWPW